MKVASPPQSFDDLTKHEDRSTEGIAESTWVLLCPFWGRRLMCCDYLWIAGANSTRLYVHVARNVVFVRDLRGAQRLSAAKKHWQCAVCVFPHRSRSGLHETINNQSRCHKLASWVLESLQGKPPWTSNDIEWCQWISMGLWLMFDVQDVTR